MNKLELTAEHMAKIFDMCHHYFPDTIVNGVVIVEGTVSFKDFNNVVIKLHWLELCLTHLSQKIIFKTSKPKHFAQDNHFRLVDQMMKLFNQEDKYTHPVDYLYKEYQKK